MLAGRKTWDPNSKGSNIFTIPSRVQNNVHEICLILKVVLHSQKVLPAVFQAIK